MGLGRATYYRPLRDWAQRDAPVIAALTTLVAAKSRWGFWKCYDRLRLDGHPWNPKRLWRVYCQLHLNLPCRTKKRLPVRLRQPLVVIPQPNAVSAVDFMSDTLYGGRRFRTLNVLDEGVRKGLAIEIDTSLPAERVVRVLEQVVAWRGRPQAIRLDNVLYAERKLAVRTDLLCAVGPATLHESAYSQWSSTWCEALLTIVIQGPRSGLDRTPHSRQPQWKLRALSTRSVPASTARANGVLHWEGVPQSTADSRSPS